MKKHYAVWLVAAGLLSSLNACSRVAATEKDGNAPATNPRLGLVTEINAMSPNPSLGNQAEVVGRLVGTWDVEYTPKFHDALSRAVSLELLEGAYV